MQIVPPQGSMRHSVESERAEAHELLSQPLQAPTGPWGAVNFRNVAGSQISYPYVCNVYLGDFWGDEGRLEEFSKAVVENGYLDPLRELGYGTGSGEYLGSVHVPPPADAIFSDQDARQTIRTLVDAGTLHADNNTLFFLILPSGVTSRFADGSASCTRFCGYHDVVTCAGIDIAYAVIPSPECDECGSSDLSKFTAVYAHELAEACTDKVPGKGWISADGMENGDLEAWLLYPWGPPSDSKRFAVQGYYTNERGNTIGAWREKRVAAAPFAATAIARPQGPKKRNAFWKETRLDGQTVVCMYSDGQGGYFKRECQIPWGEHCPNPWPGDI
jgi:hypothetical protein